MDTINKYIEQSESKVSNLKYTGKELDSYTTDEVEGVSGVKFLDKNEMSKMIEESRPKGIFKGDVPLIYGTSDKGLRYNQGKLRYDLIHPVAEKGLVQVLTKGSQKYAERNWEKGMKWSNIISSLKRHIAAIEAGEDYDKETGLLHADHVQCNAHFLSAYYKIYPEGDDRPHKYLKPKRIGLDIDDVLAEWCPTFSKLANIDIPKNWNFGFPKLVAKMIEDGMDYQEVIENLPMKTRPEDIPFEPVVYITHRNHTPVEVAERWIAKNGYAQAPVVQTENKIQACIDHKVDIFVDDKYDTFVQMNKAGICCFLFDAPHNHRYDVGHKRIYSLKELV